MRLLVCRVCHDSEPFACPFKYRRTYMELHLDKAHGLKLRDIPLSRAHETRSGPVLWKSGQGREAKLVLEEVFVPAPGLPDREGAAAMAKRVMPEGDVTQKTLESTSPVTPGKSPGSRSSPYRANPVLSKLMVAARRMHYATGGDPHGPPPARMSG